MIIERALLMEVPLFFYKGNLMKNREERKKTIYALMQDKTYVPMKIKELAIILQVAKEDRAELESILDELIKEGRISLTKRGKYIISKDEILTAQFMSTAHGYGFAVVEGEKEDYFISEKNCKDAMHGDTVTIEVIKQASPGKRKEAKVLEVLVHAVNHVVGTYDKSSKGFGFVIPDNRKFSSDIYVHKEKSMDAMSGHKVVCEITDYGSRDRSPEGKVIEILGHINDPGVDILSVIKEYDLPTEFPEKVMNRLKNVPDEVSEADRNMRRDLRDEMMVTIDGEDSKDLDDAVSCYFDGTNYHLGVHIADVANYVQENSAIDREALKRGTSVYLVDRVIPMLPHKLSNGICSLNEKEDRLALSCLMTIDKKGTVIDHEIVESVICTNARMTYTNVNAIIEDHNEEIMSKYSDLCDMFFTMKELADILRERRKKRGSIDFDLPESKIILDENGVPIKVAPYERNAATKLIEDFMLIANETVAQHFYFLELPFVYRMHEKPDAEKIGKLSNFISGFGYGLKVKGEEVHPKELQKLLSKIIDTPEEALISRLTLRSMQRAKYSTECGGHYGLACEYYCHFTSPIRRYPDLQIHRIIKDFIHGRMNDDKIEHYTKILDEVAKQSSTRERVADDAERETDKLKKCQYMEQRIGEKYTGIISGVTNWGIYVELDNTCEGLIHISKIPGDYYYFIEREYKLVGEATGNVFSLGQKIDIIVNGVDMVSKTIDFVLDEDL